jgi:hypothetical protein
MGSVMVTVTVRIVGLLNGAGNFRVKSRRGKPTTRLAGHVRGWKQGVQPKYGAQHPAKPACCGAVV